VKQDLASSYRENGLDAVEGKEGLSRKVTKNAVRTYFAVETATIVRCALHMRCYRSPRSQETVTVVTNYRDGLFVEEAKRTTTSNPDPMPTTYDALAIDFRAALFRINKVDPFDITICRFFKSANNRVTVSREVPIICAISS